MEQHMIACVHESLGLYLMENARFMAERLVAEYPSQVRSSFAHARLTVLRPGMPACLHSLRAARWAVISCCLCAREFGVEPYGQARFMTGRLIAEYLSKGWGSLVCTGEAVETCSAAGSAQTWTATQSGLLEDLQEALTLTGAGLLEGRGHQILQQPESD